MGSYCTPWIPCDFCNSKLELQLGWVKFELACLIQSKVKFGSDMFGFGFSSVINLETHTIQVGFEFRISPILSKMQKCYNFVGTIHCQSNTLTFTVASCELSKLKIRFLNYSYLSVTMRTWDPNSARLCFVRAPEHKISTLLQWAHAPLNCAT